MRAGGHSREGRLPGAEARMLLELRDFFHARGTCSSPSQSGPYPRSRYSNIPKEFLIFISFLINIIGVSLVNKNLKTLTHQDICTPMFTAAFPSDFLQAHLNFLQ